MALGDTVPLNHRPLRSGVEHHSLRPIAILQCHSCLADQIPREVGPPNDLDRACAKKRMIEVDIDDEALAIKVCATNVVEQTLEVGLRVAPALDSCLLVQAQAE